MRSLLLILLAAIALPTAVNTEVANYYLLIQWKKNSWEPKGNGKDGFPYYICVKAK